MAFQRGSTPLITSTSTVVTLNVSSGTRPTVAESQSPRLVRRRHPTARRPVVRVLLEYLRDGLVGGDVRGGVERGVHPRVDRSVVRVTSHLHRRVRESRKRGDAKDGRVLRHLDAVTLVHAARERGSVRERRVVLQRRVGVVRGDEKHLVQGRRGGVVRNRRERERRQAGAVVVARHLRGAELTADGHGEQKREDHQREGHQATRAAFRRVSDARESGKAVARRPGA